MVLVCQATQFLLWLLDYAIVVQKQRGQTWLSDCCLPVHALGDSYPGHGVTLILPSSQ